MVDENKQSEIIEVSFQRYFFCSNNFLLGQAHLFIFDERVKNIVGTFSLVGTSFQLYSQHNLFWEGLSLRKFYQNFSRPDRKSSTGRSKNCQRVDSTRRVFRNKRLAWCQNVFWCYIYFLTSRMVERQMLPNLEILGLWFSVKKN